MNIDNKPNAQLIPIENLTPIDDAKNVIEQKSINISIGQESLDEAFSGDDDNISGNQQAARPIHKYQGMIDSWSRDSYGLLPNVEYKFLENGLIDFFKLVPQKYLTPNKDKFPKDFNFTSIKVEELEQSKLLILLGGLKYVAKIRGVKSVKQQLVQSNDSFASAICTVTFIPNYESGMQEISISGEGDAHPKNTYNFARNYLTAIACNRAYARSIKMALGIECLAYDELGGATIESEGEAQSSNSISPIEVLKTLLKNYSIADESFIKLAIKHKWIQSGFNDVNKFPVEYVHSALEAVKIAVSKRK